MRRQGRPHGRDPASVDALIKLVIACVCRVYDRDYHPPRNLDESEFIIYSSLGQRQKPSKYSYHVVTPVYGANIGAVQQFTNATMLAVETAGHELEDYIDRQIPRRWGSSSACLLAPSWARSARRSWTRLGCRLGMAPLEANCHWSEGLIGWYSSETPFHFIEELEHVPMRSIVTNPNLRAKTALLVEIATAWWATTHVSAPPFGAVWEAREASGNCLFSDRFQASVCAFCSSIVGRRVVHEHDNTLMLTLGRRASWSARVCVLPPRPCDLARRDWSCSR